MFSGQGQHQRQSSGRRVICVTCGRLRKAEMPPTPVNGKASAGTNLTSWSTPLRLRPKSKQGFDLFRPARRSTLFTSSGRKITVCTKRHRRPQAWVQRILASTSLSSLTTYPGAKSVWESERYCNLQEPHRRRSSMPGPLLLFLPQMSVAGSVQTRRSYLYACGLDDDRVGFDQRVG